MSEPTKTKSYMQELDLWSDTSIIGPLFQAWQQWAEHRNEERYGQAVDLIKKRIREKVLESYHNGLKAQNMPTRMELR
jgi:hypothetical protein